MFELNHDPSAFSLLKTEWRKSVFEFENIKKIYLDSRNSVQQIWDKLSSLKFYISQLDEEIVNLKAEIIRKESKENSSIDIENVTHPGIAEITILHSTRSAAVKKYNENMELQESLELKIIDTEEQLQDLRSTLSLQSETVRVLQHETTESSMDSSFVDKSMRARGDLIVTSRKIDELESQLLRFTVELEHLRQEFRINLSSVNNFEENVEDSISRQISKIDTITGELSLPSKSDLNDILSDGPAFSKELNAFLLSGQSFIRCTISSELHKDVEVAMLELSLDEVLSKNMQIFRINGELPFGFLQRLERRRATLLLIEEKTFQEFAAKLQEVKHNKDQAKTCEIRRLRLEVQLNRFETWRPTNQNLSPDIPQDTYNASLLNAGGSSTSAVTASSTIVPIEPTKATTKAVRKIPEDGNVLIQNCDDLKFTVIDGNGKNVFDEKRWHIYHQSGSTSKAIDSPVKSLTEISQVQVSQNKEDANRRPEWDSSTGQADLETTRELRTLIRGLPIDALTNRDEAKRQPEVLIKEEREILALISMYLKHREFVGDRSHERAAREIERRILASLLHRDLQDISLDTTGDILSHIPKHLLSAASAIASKGISDKGTALSLFSEASNKPVSTPVRSKIPVLGAKKSTQGLDLVTTQDGSNVCSSIQAPALFISESHDFDQTVTKQHNKNSLSHTPAEKLRTKSNTSSSWSNSALTQKSTNYSSNTNFTLSSPKEFFVPSVSSHRRKSKPTYSAIKEEALVAELQADMRHNGLIVEPKYKYCRLCYSLPKGHIDWREEKRAKSEYKPRYRTDNLEPHGAQNEILFENYSQFSHKSPEKIMRFAEVEQSIDDLLKEPEPLLERVHSEADDWTPREMISSSPNASATDINRIIPSQYKVLSTEAAMKSDSSPSILRKVKSTMISPLFSPTPQQQPRMRPSEDGVEIPDFKDSKPLMNLEEFSSSIPRLSRFEKLEKQYFNMQMPVGASTAPTAHPSAVSSKSPSRKSSPDVFVKNKEVHVFADSQSNSNIDSPSKSLKRGNVSSPKALLAHVDENRPRKFHASSETTAPDASLPELRRRNLIDKETLSVQSNSYNVSMRATSTEKIVQADEAPLENSYHQMALKAKKEVSSGSRNSGDIGAFHSSNEKKPADAVDSFLQPNPRPLRPSIESFDHFPRDLGFNNELSSNYFPRRNQDGESKRNQSIPTQNSLPKETYSDSPYRDQDTFSAVKPTISPIASQNYLYGKVNQHANEEDPMEFKKSFEVCFNSDELKCLSPSLTDKDKNSTSESRGKLVGSIAAKDQSLRLDSSFADILRLLLQQQLEIHELRRNQSQLYVSIKSNSNNSSKNENYFSMAKDESVKVPLFSEMETNNAAALESPTTKRPSSLVDIAIQANLEGKFLFPSSKTTEEAKNEEEENNASDADEFHHVVSDYRPVIPIDLSTNKQSVNSFFRSTNRLFSETNELNPVHLSPIISMSNQPLHSPLSNTTHLSEDLAVSDAFDCPDPEIISALDPSRVSNQKSGGSIYPEGSGNAIGCSIPIIYRILEMLEKRSYELNVALQDQALSSSASSRQSIPTEIQVEVILAKHLSAMKKLTRSSDPYVELILLEIVPAGVSLEGQAQNYKEPTGYGSSDLLDMLAHLKEVDYDILSGDCQLRADCSLESLEKQFKLGIRVRNYQRTSVQYETCYPQWRETVKFSGHDEKSELLLWVIIRDSAKMAHVPRIRDEIIAQSSLSLSSFFLTDNSSAHRISLPLHLPHPQRWLRGRPALDSRATLLLQIETSVSHAGRLRALLAELFRLQNILRQIYELAIHRHTNKVIIEGDIRRRLYRVFRRSSIPPEKETKHKNEDIPLQNQEPVMVSSFLSSPNLVETSNHPIASAKSSFFTPFNSDKPYVSQISKKKVGSDGPLRSELQLKNSPRKNNTLIGRPVDNHFVFASKERNDASCDLNPPVDYPLSITMSANYKSKNSNLELAITPSKDPTIYGLDKRGDQNFVSSINQSSSSRPVNLSIFRASGGRSMIKKEHFRREREGRKSIHRMSGRLDFANLNIWSSLQQIDKYHEKRHFKDRIVGKSNVLLR